MNIKSKHFSSAKIEYGITKGILGPLLFLLYANNLKQAVDCDSFLYADESCLVYQHNDVSKIEQNLNKNFSNISYWFVDDNLCIHFGEDKRKCILFATKQKINKTGNPNIRQGTIQIKQYHTITCLGCTIGENISGETMALKVISKFNCRLRLLYRKIDFYRNLFLDYFARLWYNLILIMRLGVFYYVLD